MLPTGWSMSSARDVSTECCSKQPSYGVADSKKAEYCAQHAPDGIFNVVIKRCVHGGFSMRPSYGVVESKKAKYCTHHAPTGMANV